MSFYCLSSNVYPSPSCLYISAKFLQVVHPNNQVLKLVLRFCKAQLLHWSLPFAAKRQISCDVSQSKWCYCSKGKFVGSRLLEPDTSVTDRSTFTSRQVKQAWTLGKHVKQENATLCPIFFLHTKHLLYPGSNWFFYNPCYFLQFIGF